jgi:hypothetical protein
MFSVSLISPGDQTDRSQFYKKIAAALILAQGWRPFGLECLARSARQGVETVWPQALGPAQANWPVRLKKERDSKKGGRALHPIRAVHVAPKSKKETKLLPCQVLAATHFSDVFSAAAAFFRLVAAMRVRS